MKNISKKILKLIENYLLRPHFRYYDDWLSSWHCQKMPWCLDNTLELLTNIEFDLNDKKNNELISDMELHNLFDMTEDVAEFEKIKRAESKLIQRQYEHI